jgi:CheY-like chemotaxis protein
MTIALPLRLRYHVRTFVFVRRRIMATWQTNPILLLGSDLLILGLAAMLRARGRRVLARGGEHQDLDMVLAGPRPAAIMIDLMTAWRDDFALLRRIRLLSQFSGVPVLVLSLGTVTDDHALLDSRLRALGVQPLLSPHDLDDVLNELERSLVSVA